MQKNHRGRGVPSKLGLLATATLMLLTAACGSSGKGASPSTSSPTPSTRASSPSSSTAPTSAGLLTIYLIGNEHVVAVGRRTTSPETPEAAVRVLLLGPKGALERGLRLTSAIPSGTELRSVTVADRVATVDLSHEFSSGGGSLSMQERVAQVVFTLTAFPAVDRVRFRIDGSPVSTIGGEGLMVDNVDRSTFANVTPKILVESPTPGARVQSPFRVTGMSNTFEATVNYTLTDGAGTVLAKGFTTATAGTGTWGTFAFDVTFAATKPGLGRLAVYEVSPKDGSHVNLTSVPLTLS